MIVHPDPASSEVGIHKTVKARFWTWLEPFFNGKFLGTIEVVPSPLASG